MANLSSIREKLHGAEIEEQKVVTEFSSLEDIYGVGFKNEYQTRIQESVDNVIKNSKNLICALEGIGAMYCIPAGHIMRNDDINTIKISGDNIIAPGNVGAANNKHAVVRAIAALLDKKSMGIDDKLDAHHKHHCHELFKQEPQFTPDPGKGTVVGRYLDDEDNEILVYNTGMVDCKSCPSSMKKIDELRKQGLIPDYNIALVQGSDVKNPVANYFADMDDITAGVDMQTSTTSNTTTGEDSVSGMDTTDIASDIEECDTLVEAYSLFGDTRHLGYDIMSLQGFDFVKPTTDVITEADDDTKKVSKIKPSDLKYMRFDNKHIIKAVKLINDWIKDNHEGKELNEIPFQRLYQSNNFKEAVDELSEQFDANINVRFTDAQGAFNVYTTMSEERAQKLREITISKSKGFQFSGNKIDIHIEGKNTIRDISMGKPEFAGQCVVSILLHEIFHNAMYVWRVADAEFQATLSLSLQLAMAEKKAKKRRKIVTNFVNYIDSFYGVKMNAVTRKVVIKRLTVITGIKNESTLEKLKRKIKEVASGKKKNNEESVSIDKDVESIVDLYEKHVKTINKHYSTLGVIGRCLLWSLAGGMMGGTAALAGIGSAGAEMNKKHGAAAGLGALSVVSYIMAVGCGLTSWGVLIDGIIFNAAKKNYANSKDLEEQWADMFAAMYKLPVTFKVMTQNNSYTPDQVSKEVMERYNRVSIDIGRLIMDCHPSDAERNRLSVKICKDLLADKKHLDPECVKYLEWLQKAYGQLGEQSEIDNIYNKSVFDPTEADNLDEHIQHLCDISGATVTEFTAYDVCDWNIISE